MKNEVWVLGATGRTGKAIAKLLQEKGVPLALVGREKSRLEAVAAEIGGTPRLIVGSFNENLARITTEGPVVVVNTVGPFKDTALKVCQACPPSTHYLDVSNEFEAAENVLDLDRKAAAANQTFVTGAGFGVLSTESILLKLCEGQPPAKNVRIDAIASVAIESGTVGVALAATILEVLAFGGRQVRQGKLVRTPLVANGAEFTTPAGDLVSTGGGASGELLAAWRGSKAENVVSALAGVPTGLLAKIFVPVVGVLIRVPAIKRFAIRRMAAIATKAKPKPRSYSWGHAKIEWADGKVREGWLRAGEGMDFTSAVAAETAHRLFKGEGKPGAYTPGALFGPELAEAAGGEFVIEGVPATASLQSKL